MQTGNSRGINDKQSLEGGTAAGLVNSHVDSSPSVDSGVQLTDNAKIVLQKRYLRKDTDGQVAETPDGMFRRVAKAIATPETMYGSDPSIWEEKFFEIMASLEFVPNSPTLMNAGIEQPDGQGTGTLSACFVMGLEDSMQDIMTTAKEMAMVQKFGGGTGFALSPIRSKGSSIKTTHGNACGPVAVLKHLSSVSKLVTQGGKRDGANMAVMDVHHPDVTEFIDCKKQEGDIHNFNISVGASHEFMEAVKADSDYPLRARKDPTDLESPFVEVGRISARDIFNKIIEGAWRNGEPGLIFLDWVNHKNPTPHIGRMTATNPCGEQPLLPYESCNLGSVDLDKFLIEREGELQVDYLRLRDVIRSSTRFLDNVIDANSYSVDKIEKMTRDTRKIGLGVMGFADMLARLRIPYDSEEGLEMGRKIMRFIMEESDAMSEELAEERGVFPAYQGSIYDSPDQPKMRNACRLTVAPTGTISMIAGCSSGIEPLFALCYHKHNILGGESLIYVDKGFENAAKEDGFYSEDLMNYLADGGSLQEREDVPEWARKVFVTSADISPEMHVRMQAAFQESVDAAISKTINFPNSATQDDVRSAYMLAWELGCKGITVYRAGSREEEVLTIGTDAKNQSGDDILESTIQDSPAVLTERERPAVISGVTERVRTAQGNMFVTVNFDEDGQPFEVFGTLGKSGGTESAQLEAISRMVSLSLRSGVDPKNIVDQLRGITAEPVWDSGRLVRSAPDAVALVLSRHIESIDRLDSEDFSDGESDSTTQLGLFGSASDVETADDPSTRSETSSFVSGLTCSECSVGILVHQEGCLRCPDCGYNKCE
ncbi:MAG TPA: ribonucleotide-diphosphate reductase subunit alpha [Chloroflexi bacterium]|nr:ribonucleotide-diphosphate reductase subunit alpha [Chloroflexota bacterium]